MKQILNPHILIPNMIDSIDFNSFFYRFRKAYYIIFQALITKKWMFEASNATFKIHESAISELDRLEKPTIWIELSSPSPRKESLRMKRR